jgi:hypothetical protein
VTEVQDRLCQAIFINYVVAYSNLSKVHLPLRNSW